jgi:hypothetical protein
MLIDVLKTRTLVVIVITKRFVGVLITRTLVVVTLPKRRVDVLITRRLAVVLTQTACSHWITLKIL